MNNKKISFVVVCFILSLFSFSAFAGTPRCGEIKRHDIDGAFDAAWRVRASYNILSDLEGVCDVLHRLSVWEKDQSVILLSDQSYLHSKQNLLLGIRVGIMDLEQPLIRLRIWLKAAPESRAEELRRLSSIRGSYKIIKAGLESLQSKGEAVTRLMEYKP